MPCGHNPYVLPTIDFVGGETQKLLFNIYFHEGNTPFSLSGCTANFSIVNYLNRTGAPILSKTMQPVLDANITIDNKLTVTLLPEETVDLFGKYIYQIIIRDIDGETEVPKQGILYITNNINKNYIKN